MRPIQLPQAMLSADKLDYDAQRSYVMHAILTRRFQFADSDASGLLDSAHRGYGRAVTFTSDGKSGRRLWSLRYRFVPFGGATFYTLNSRAL